MERSALDELRECAERTLAAGSARIHFAYHMDAALPERKPRRRGGLLRPVLRPARAAGRWAWNYVAENWSSFRFDGFVEPARRRHMLAVSEETGTLKNWAELERDGKRFSGRPGQPVATLDPVRGRGFTDVWFLLDSLRGLEAATGDGEDVIRGTPCRRLAARVDLARASAAVEDGIHPPSVDRFEDLLSLPFTVWIDGTHVRRVRFEEEQPSRSWQIDLWEFGVPTAELDWSRLPRLSAGDEPPAPGSPARALLRRLRSRRKSAAAT